MESVFFKCFVSSGSIGLLLLGTEGSGGGVATTEKTTEEREDAHPSFFTLSNLRTSTPFFHFSRSSSGWTFDQLR